MNNTSLSKPVPAAQLADALGLPLTGPQREVSEVCSLDRLDANKLSFILPSGQAPSAAGTVFALPGTAADGLSVIASPNPRLDFIRAQYLLAASPGFLLYTTPPQVHPTVRVGLNTVIENGVEIGEGTTVGHNVVIHGGTRIGKRCAIKSGAVIGEAGFGFERDEKSRPIKMIHLGGVRIGDDVEIGSLTTVCRGALGDTILGDHVKLDDHVHVAHNCRIGEGTMITACAELSGSVRVGRNAWLAPNCSIIQKISIGDGAFIGIGAVVARDVEPGTKVFGNPAKKLPGSSPA